MINSCDKKLFGLFLGFLVLLLSAAARADSVPVDSGNRYNLPRYYESEISAASAYLLSREGRGDEEEHGREARRGRHLKPVILDVRSIWEYVHVGHPAKAINIPYPLIITNQASSPWFGDPSNIQDPKTFFDAVAAAVPDRDTPIFTLCKTGHRSVLSADILSNPGAYIPGYEDVAPYRHVRNIWQGFEGRPKVDFYGGTPLDLNNDGQITDADNDGWKNFQALPYSMKLLPQLLYLPYYSFYFE